MFPSDGSPVPALEPRSDGFDEMLSVAARKRRARRVRGVLAASPVVLAALVATALPRDGAPAQVRFANSPAPSWSSPVPGGRESTSGGDAAVPSVQPSALSSAEPPPPATAPPSDVPSSRSTPGPTDEPLGRVSREPATYEYLPGAGRCEAAGTPIPAGGVWCGGYVGSRTLKAGSEVSLPFRACWAGALGLAGEFNGLTEGRWLVVAVVSADGERTRWGWEEVSPPSGAVIEVASGDCVQWTVGWNGNDWRGQRLKAGTYKLYHWFAGEEDMSGVEEPLTLR